MMQLPGVEVSADKVPSELARVWRESAKADAKEEKLETGVDTPARVKTILSNMVILLARDQYESLQGDLNSLIAELCVSHPARFFITILSDEEGKGIKSSVSSRCVLARNGKHVCSEEIFLHVPKNFYAAVPNLWMSLEVADVSTSVVTFGTYQGIARDNLGDIFKSFSAEVDLFICDSKNFSNFASEYEFVESIFPVLPAQAFGEGYIPEIGLPEIARSQMRVRDLSWGRFSRIRQLISDQFESEEFRDSISKIKAVELKVPSDLSGSERKVCAEALLLGGWIASRLDSSTQINFLSQPAEMGEIYQVEFSLEGALEEAATLRCIFDVSNEEAFISFFKGKEELSKRRISLPRQADELIILSEMYSSGRTESYRAAVEQAKLLAGSREELSFL